MVQWAEVEGNFAQYYGYSMSDILSMKWRRFRVLFGHIFSWKTEEQDEQDGILGPDGLGLGPSPSSGPDGPKPNMSPQRSALDRATDDALGKDTPTKVNKISMNEFARKYL